MKKALLILAAFLTQVNFAQNTFPSTGKAGVGTTNPVSNLHVYSQESPANFLTGQFQIGGSYNVTNDIFLSIGINKTGEYAFMNAGKGGIGNIPLALMGGNVGIGTTTPTSKLEVKGTIKSMEYTPLGDPVNSSQLLNEVGARGGSIANSNSIYKRLWSFRDDASTADWLTTRFHDGISVDGVYNIPHVDTKTWWERDPYDNIQSWGNDAQTYLTINKGNVGIGTISPDSRLAVNGTIHSKEVKVDMLGWPDFVFKKEYNLPTLEEVEKHIIEKGHLENIPSEEEVIKSGINLGEMDAKLLQKIEELTLYMIEMKKDIADLRKENIALKTKKK
ncbi:hypothetical protein D3C85_617960 [compost metagenome]